MKKILALTLALLLMFGCMSVVFGDEPGKIEISFKVGDSILNINGKSVEVETPYVVDGVTLVPLRVITEAFGATVDWAEDTQKITLTYEDVEIVLQIDNINAYVNGQKQALLYPPQIKNEKTMVPLRFITETFGADVQYDDKTEGITVIKTLTPPPSPPPIVPDRKAFVGDSYYNWSMKQSSDLELSYRTFDGRENDFALGSDTSLSISFGDNTDNITFDALKGKALELAKNFTLVSQKVLKTKSGIEYISTQFRDSKSYADFRSFLRPSGDIVTIALFMDLSTSAEDRQKYVDILDSFDFTMSKDDTDDLSDVTDGMRLFDQKDFKIEFRLPADWRDKSNKNRVNVFYFSKYDKDGMLEGRGNLEIYSNEDNDTASAWAAESLTTAKKETNSDLCTFGEIKSMTIGSATASYYQYEVKINNINYIADDIYWEYEGFLYNLSVEVRKNNESLIQKVIDSVNFEAINPDDVGILSKPTNEDEAISTINNTSIGFTVGVPASWAYDDVKENFSDKYNEVLVSFMKLKDGHYTQQDVGNILSSIQKNYTVKVTKKVAAINKADLASTSYSGFMFEFSEVEKNSLTYYISAYVINVGNSTYVINVSIPLESYSDANKEIVANIIKSFTVN